MQGRWWVCGLLLLATILNYLDRQVLSLTAEKIIDEFGVTKEGFGMVLSAFRYSYAVMQIAGGWLVDSAGVRWLYPGAVGLWSVAGMLTAAVSSIGGLAGMRFLLGIGEAFNWPCALKTTERLLPPKDRPLANGIFNSGTAVGAMLAPVIVTFMTLRWGWRSAFIVTGALGFFWVIAWILYTRRFDAALRGAALRMRDAPATMGRIARLRGFWALVASAIIVNGVSYFLADWIPLYLKTERGFSFGVGNALSMLVYAGLDAGNLLVGFFVRARVAAGADVVRARHTALFLSCVLMSLAVFAGFAASPWVALACLVATAIGVAGFLVIYLTLVQELDLARVGTTAGMLGGLGNLCYGFVSPYIGRLADLNQSAWTFAIVGILPWIALGSILLGFRKTARQP
ncbi:MAG: MFS transporter [Bryobacterales bacterium]|nr:MFS transporter [Bryobacterales bacterium]